MSVSFKVVKLDELSILIEKYKTLIINLIILLKNTFNINKVKLVLDIQTIRCMSLLLKSIYTSIEKLILVFEKDEELILYEQEYINVTVQRFCDMILTNLLTN